MDKFDLNNAKKEFYRDLKNRAALRNIGIIRTIYQVLFYLSVIGFFFIINKLNSIKAETLIYISVIVSYFLAYCILLMLRAIEYLTSRFIKLEQELANKDIITIDSEKTCI